jgi:hypothetical protein
MAKRTVITITLPEYTPDISYKIGHIVNVAAVAGASVEVEQVDAGDEPRSTIQLPTNPPRPKDYLS